MLDSTTTRPKWLGAEIECDITDDWQEQTDPNAEFGEVVSAHIDVLTYNGPDCYPDMYLWGITVIDGRDTRYLDRDSVTIILGSETVERIERAAAEGWDERAA